MTYYEEIKMQRVLTHTHKLRGGKCAGMGTSFLAPRYSLKVVVFV